MTVASEASYNELTWTGVETLFSPGFAAEQKSDVTVQYVDSGGTLQTLIQNTHYAVALDGSLNVTVTPIALPSASPSAPVVLQIGRNTPALQGTDFANLATYDKSTLTVLFDRMMRVAAELKGRLARVIQPFTVNGNIVDFGTKILRAGYPVGSGDVATKAYADTVSGTSSAIAAAASAAASAVSATSASGSATAAAASAASAASNAALLASPDMGFFSSSVTSTTDLGSTW